MWFFWFIVGSVIIWFLMYLILFIMVVINWVLRAVLRVRNAFVGMETPRELQAPLEQYATLENKPKQVFNVDNYGAEEEGMSPFNCPNCGAGVPQAEVDKCIEKGSGSTYCVLCGVKLDIEILGK